MFAPKTTVKISLSTFDLIGPCRNTPSRTEPVDASGVFQTAKTFHEVAGLKKILLHRKDQLARSLIEELLVMARDDKWKPLTVSSIDRLLDALKQKD